ncbi:MAG: alpha/beta hydrolase [Burkholderiales bacterium]|nr:alpha/beta hydrolase [Burkholderiales bacterium]
MNPILQTSDSLALHLHCWPGPATPRGTVVLVHGLGEHAGRYTHVAAALNAAGWRVLACDQRGHGQSAGPRGGIAAPDSLLADLALVLDSARAEQPGPLVLLGHSLGGLVAARFAAESLAASPAAWSRPLDALVLSSPALDPGLNAVQKLLLAVVPALAPNLAVHNGLRPEWISRDPAVVQAYGADPLVHDRISGRLARFIADTGAEVLAAAQRWAVPTLLMWAGSDRCVAPRGSAAFAASAPTAVLSAREWPGLAHEIFNEPEKIQVLAALTQWLDATL